MKYFLTSIIAFAAVAAQAQSTVTLDIEGLGNDSLNVRTGQVVGSELIANRFSVWAEDGKATIEVPIEYPDAPVEIAIKPRSGIVKRPNTNKEEELGSRQINLILYMGESAAVRGTAKNKVIDYEVAGSEFSRAFAQFRSRYLPLEVELDSITLTFDDELLDRYYEKYEARMLEYICEEIDRDPDSELAAYLTASLPLDSMVVYQAKLGPKAKAGVWGERLQVEMERAMDFQKTWEMRAGIVGGVPAPRFTLETPDGGTLSLGDITGREYIVLDFWGTWCGPCVAGMPKMKEYYARYGDRVEFIGIDYGDSPRKWREAVRDLQLPWRHVIDEGEDKASVAYGVTGYPCKIIIDSDLNIVAKFLGEGDDFYNKLDELLAKKSDELLTK